MSKLEPMIKGCCDGTLTLRSELHEHTAPQDSQSGVIIFLNIKTYIKPITP